MAVQAQMYSDNHHHHHLQNHNLGGFPLGGTQDLFTDHHDNNVNNGIGDGGGRGLVNNFCFNFQQQKQSPPALPHMQFLQLQQDSVAARNQERTFFQPGNHQHHHRSNTVFSQMMESHKLDVDLLITLQYERLRLALQEQRKQQVAAMLKGYEWKAQFLLQQKDEEIAKGLNRMVELEQLLKGIEEENQNWEKAAKENEAIIASMNKTMEQLQQQLQEGGGAGYGNAEDVGSCCDVHVTTMENQYQNQNENGKCKICNSGNSCVILLPCRHLCCCNGCVAFIGSCPVCNVVKKASIEALF